MYITKVKEKINNHKLMVGSALAVPATFASSLVTFATTNDTSQNLTTGITGFMAIVTSMIEAIMGSAVLSIAFAASFTMLAIRLVRKLKKG